MALKDQKEVKGGSSLLKEKPFISHILMLCLKGVLDFF